MQSQADEGRGEKTERGKEKRQRGERRGGREGKGGRQRGKTGGEGLEERNKSRKSRERRFVGKLYGTNVGKEERGKEGRWWFA